MFLNCLIHSSAFQLAGFLFPGKINILCKTPKVKRVRPQVKTADASCPQVLRKLSGAARRFPSTHSAFERGWRSDADT